MKEALQRALLWDRRLTPRQATLWALLIVLAPLALVLGLWLQAEIMQRMPVDIGVDRDVAVAAARRLAEENGLTSQSWEEQVKSDDDGDAYRYLYAQGEIGRTVLRELGPWLILTAVLNDSESEHGVEVDLTPSGEVLGYRLRPSGRPPAPATEAEARAAAEEAIEQRKAKHSFWTFSQPETATGPNNTRVFKYEVRFPQLPHLSAEAVLRTQGTRILENRLRFDIEGDAKSQFFNHRLRKVEPFLYYPVVVGTFLYLMVRYIRRRLQKEASRERMHLVALILGSAFAGTVLLTDALVPPDRDVPIPHWVVLSLIALGCYLGGLFGGLAYSAAESDLREPFPDQMTSLDAWLAGKFFSRNVGRSVLLGAVIFAWLLPVRNGLYLLSGPFYPGLDALEGGQAALISHLPAASVLLGAMGTSVYLVLSVVLAPLTLVVRRFKRRKVQAAVFTLLSIIAIFHITAEPLPWYALFTLAAVEAAGLTLAFFAVDLLATLFVAAAYVLVVHYGSLAVIAPAWAWQAAPAFAFAALIIAASIVCTLWGRFVRADEVRPAYAREIQERLQLQSEVQAAKEAQQRLLPSGPPNIPGLSVAASCRAADQVSGDFYDFYTISRTRLGILVTDGGGNGLATALSIALTKGYLMHKAQAGLSPVQTLAGLLATLGQELNAVNAEGLCYAVVDVAEGTFEFARMGDTPALLVAGEDAETLQETRYGVEGGQLWEGRVRLRESSRVILYTNGVSRLIGEPDRHATNRWIYRRAASVLTQPPEELLEWLFKLVLTKRGGLGTREIRDDTTILVIARDAEAAVEQVA